jgi:Trypsin-co-occurring domain 2
MEPTDKASGLGLVEFLSDLRAELDEARRRVPPASAAGVLRLGVDEVTVTLEVAHVATTSGEVSGKVQGKFWVFGSAEASAKGGHERQRSGTQTLTLTLKPRVETTSSDEHGQSQTDSTKVDVNDSLTAEEQKAGL